MRLKSIEMQGFKSFPDKTKIAFDGGVTAIIGPNGSGKSNISDAVRWVLGEMSLKSLRGSRMEDVIFNGAAGRQPSGYSAVSLTLDTEEEFNSVHSSVFDFTEITENTEDEKSVNSKPKMRLSDHKEVVVTRKYYRTGESEYYINKAQVRLKDIYELFYDTGIGREGYSVIGQGKIAEVLSQKGDERRSIFEEAAGISKFRYKKSEAERKLRDTETNLVRINDILSEVSSRIGPLAKEAENAKQYLVFSEEKKGLEITLWLDKFDQVKAELGKSEVAFNSAKYELEQSEERVKVLELKLDSGINENYELSRLLSETEREKSDFSQQSGVLDGKIAVLRNDIEHFRRTMLENGQSRQLLQSDITAATQLLEQVKTDTDRLRAQYSASAEKTNAIQQKYEECRCSSSSVQGKAEQAEKAHSELLLKQSAVIGEGARIDAAIEQCQIIKDNSSGSISASESRSSTLEQELASKRADEKAFNEQKSILSAKKSVIENDISEQRAKLEKVREDIVARRLSLAADEQKREHLIRLEQLLEGYSESVRSVMTDSAQGKIKTDGKPVCIHGTVSSVISAEGEYVIALETALAAAVQFIIVESEQDAKAAIQHLKDNKAGRATFLPLTTVKGRKSDVSELKNIPGFIGIASELAKYDSKYQGIIDDLLGRTIIAVDIDSAVAIAAKSGYKIKTVTCDGQVINAGGSFTGGSVAKKVGLLTRSADIDRLSADIRSKNALLLEKEREAATLNKQIEQFNEQFYSLENQLSEKKNVLDSLAADSNRLSFLLEEEQKRREELLSGSADEEQKLSLLLLKKEEYALSSKQDGERLEAARTALAAARENADVFRREEEALYQELNAARLDLYENRILCDKQEEASAQLVERITGYETRIASLNENDAKAIENILSSEKEITVHEGEKAVVSEEINKSEEKLQRMLTGRESQEKEISTLRQSLRQAQVEKEEIFRRYTGLEAMQTKLSGEYEDISAKLWDEYELTYSSALPFRLPEDKMVKAFSRLGALKSKIRAMGSINVNAVEEYRQEKERYDFLTLQTDDLNKSRRSLDIAIAKLNNEMKHTFVECFNKINIAFGEVFCALFGGGSAYIELADPDSPLECGIDIILKPPGKSVRSISLLSGGEQSFAAIALYLALQKINPAPFCIFDEIESALDDINLVKFADYVRENSRGTQYILITHRRGTMERADTLYGVTMRQKGISDYIRLNVAKLEESIKEYTE